MNRNQIIKEWCAYALQMILMIVILTPLLAILSSTQPMTFDKWFEIVNLIEVLIYFTATVIYHWMLQDLKVNQSSFNEWRSEIADVGESVLIITGFFGGLAAIAIWCCLVFQSTLYLLFGLYSLSTFILSLRYYLYLFTIK